MPITTLDSRTALIVIDLQKGIVGMPAAHPIAGVIQNAAALADAFRSQNLPVVLVNVDAGAPGRTDLAPRIGSFPAGWTELIPELKQSPADIVVTKRTWGAFSNTGLAETLKACGTTQVLIVGVATTAGVESTARQAHELGFHVTLATDAMTDMSPEAHTHSVTRIFPRIAETGTTQEILTLMKSLTPHPQSRLCA